MKYERDVSYKEFGKVAMYVLEARSYAKKTTGSPYGGD
jgi:hypothetical protein